MPCKQDHQHPPWPTSGVHDLDIQPCETKCGWCDYEAKGASRANNLRSHARGFAHVSNPDNHSLRGITILRGKAGRKFRVENSSNRNPISTQCDAPPENSRPKDIVNSNGGMNLDVKGRKKRKDYPSSWGCPTTQIKMKERVLSIFDGPSTLWKDDTMPPDPQPTRDDSLVASSVEMSESIMHNDRQGISDTVHNERLAESPDLPTFVVAKPALAETSETQRPNSVVSEHNPQAIIGAHEPPLPSWTVSEAGRFVIEKLGMATWRRQESTVQLIHFSYEKLQILPRDMPDYYEFKLKLTEDMLIESCRRQVVDPSCKMEIIKHLLPISLCSRIRRSLLKSYCFYFLLSKSGMGDKFHPVGHICGIEQYLASPCEEVPTTERDWWWYNRFKYGSCMSKMARELF